MYNVTLFGIQHEPRAAETPPFGRLQGNWPLNHTHFRPLWPGCISCSNLKSPVTCFSNQKMGLISVLQMALLSMQKCNSYSMLSILIWCGWFWLVYWHISPFLCSVPIIRSVDGATVATIWDIRWWMRISSKVLRKSFFTTSLHGQVFASPTDKPAILLGRASL